METTPFQLSSKGKAEFPNKIGTSGLGRLSLRNEPYSKQIPLHMKTLGICWIVYGIFRLAMGVAAILLAPTATVMFGALLTRVADPFLWMDFFPCSMLAAWRSPCLPACSASWADLHYCAMPLPGEDCCSRQVFRRSPSPLLESLSAFIPSSFCCARRSRRRLPSGATRRFARTSADRYRPIQAGLQIPARLIAIVRKQRVDAAERFDRLHLIDLIVKFAALLRNGQHARARYALKRTRRRGVAHADAKVKIVRGVDQDEQTCEPSKDALENPYWCHSSEYSRSRRARMLRGYCLISTGVPILMVEPKRL